MGGQLERWRPADGRARGPLVARLNRGMSAFVGGVQEVRIVDGATRRDLQASDGKRRTRMHTCTCTCAQCTRGGLC